MSTHQQKLFDHLVTAVILLDNHLQLISMNNAGETLLSISAVHIAGRPFHKYFHESPDALQQMYNAVKNQTQYIQRKARWRLHTGHYITVDYTVTPIAESQQLLLEIQPLDRLLRINHEETLLSTQTTSKNLIRGLAHEVKNPLGGIRGAAQLLDTELKTEALEELRAYTRIIMAESDRLRNLVDNMLGPRQALTMKATNIHQVLERVVAITHAETVDKISILRNYDPSIPDIPGDTESLIQAILNIVRNAVQALVEQPNNTDSQITLGTRINRQFTIGRILYPLVIHISIEDNGPGISSELINDIFYPMISGRATGSGLGLAIAQQLITQHRGLIECTSKPRQTIFSVYLPLDATQ